MIFTPRISKTGEDRIHMDIDGADLARTRRNKGNGKWVAAVTDLKTGKRYAVRDLPCGLGCRCDAVILREIENTSVH